MPLHRHAANPILTRADIPSLPPHLVDVSAVFNPGAIGFENGTTLLLRVQNRGRETFLVPARSGDGVRFTVEPRAAEIHGLGPFGRVYHVYDPRITRIEGRLWVTLALDLDGGSRVAVARTEDLRSLDVVGITEDSDRRNGVLFPERIGGRYALLERPNRVFPSTAEDPRAEKGPGDPPAGNPATGNPATGNLPAGDPPTGDVITLSLSDDLIHWEPAGEVALGRPRYWDERIGPGTPPVKTREGWLLLYHGVATHFAGVNLYQAGALLLDLSDPTRVLARTRYNLLEPREGFEIAGQVPNVVFPSGWVVEHLDRDGFAGPESPVRVYYGAADTSIGLATTTIGELLADCREGSA